MVPDFKGAEARFRSCRHSGDRPRPLEGQGALPADRLRVAAAQVHALAIAASLRSRAGDGVGQTEFPQEGPELWPAAPAQGNANGRSASPGATVPIRRGQIREAEKTRFQF